MDIELIRVDFYLLKSKTYSRLTIACRLIEKAYQQGYCIQVLTDTALEAEEINKLLWTFSDASFIPHRLLEDRQNINQALKIPVDISDFAFYEQYAQKLSEKADIICNLSSHSPDFFLKFKRVIEIVNEQETASLEKSRQKYRFYREKKCELHSHVI